MNNNINLAFSQIKVDEFIIIVIFTCSFGDLLVTGIGPAVDCAGSLFAGIYNGSAVHKIDPRHDYNRNS